ncbi:MAG TPA: response regulator [Acidimicrobiales bacterium]|nr:response regulator [Acidimicrobiales bacterium]
MTPNSAVPILVVDDDASKRLALKAILSPLGYLIVEADSGLEALRCVMAQDFAVILLDVCMPIMDGFEAAGLIRQRRQSEITPIIFITAFASDEIRTADLYAEGAVDFIFAPVPPAELRAKVSVFANLFLRAEGLATLSREVQQSADQLRLLTEAAPIGIFQTDVENRYVYTNPRWSELTGVPSEEAAGRAWDTVLNPEDRAELAAKMATESVSRTELSHRFQIMSTTGSSRVLLLTSRPISDTHGGISGWVGTLADITAEAGAEAAMSDARDDATEASRLKSDFLANMSHEIRTPMNGIMGMTDLLLETDLDGHQRDYAQTVRNSSEALLTILNDILDFSKIEAGRLVIEDIGFSIRTTVADVVDLLAGTAQTKGLELVAVVDSSVPAVVSGDPGRVRQVLTNLIGNAIKFTAQGEVVVRVTLAQTKGPSALLRFEVSDTGDGIAPDHLASIFQPFVQADTSTSRKYGGTGLGLAISGQLVALMGGDCGVSSTLGEGSSFWFTTRFQVDEAQGRHDKLSLDADLAGVAVLIVDDNYAQRDVLSGFVTDWGMNVTSVGSGETGLTALRDAAGEGQGFSVAVIDRCMPGMDGLQLKDAIVADPTLTTRLVIITGLGAESELDATERSGVSATLSKPVHREHLRSCLRAALGRAEALSAPLDATAGRLSAPGRPHRGRLLLAEDNVINQKVAVAMLSGSGYSVDVVADGAAAVEANATQAYDAILMDCQMPVLNGYEATAAIRAHEGSDRHTPIIAMTAGARVEDRERCLAGGMDSYLAKPVSKDVLLGLVAKYVGTGPIPTPAPPVPSQQQDPPNGTEETAHDGDSIDEEILGELFSVMGDESSDDLTRIFDLFQSGVPTRLADAECALAEGRLEDAGRVAHNLRGAAGTFGARHLSGLCDQLEQVCSRDDAPAARSLLVEMHAEFLLFRSIVSSRVASVKGPGNIDAALGTCAENVHQEASTS